ncbi:MAG: alpha-ketoacid dehydrogenase subunit beta [Acidimicrobiia bacterium]
MAVMTMVEAINHTLHEEMARDDRVLVFGQDVAVNGGVFRATDGLLDRFGGRRVVDTPLAEGVIIGTAVGLAAEGMVPVPEIQFLGFAWQAFHQLAGQLARMRYRSHGRFDAPVTVRAPFGGGVRTPELHSEAIEAQLVQCPGLKVVLPGSAADAKGLLASSIRDPDPVMFLEPLKGYRLIKDEVPEGEHLVPLGQARVVRPGDDVTVIAWSAQVEVARKAAEVLAAEHGLSAEVLDLRTLVPLDVESIVASVERTGRAVVVQEAPLSAGFASEVVATICEEAFYSLEAPIARVSGYDVPYPVGMLEDRYVPDVDRAVAAVRRTCDDAR